MYNNRYMHFQKEKNTLNKVYKELTVCCYLKHFIHCRYFWKNINSSLKNIDTTFKVQYVHAIRYCLNKGFFFLALKPNFMHAIKVKQNNLNKV